MDTLAEYIKMCWKAREDIKPLWDVLSLDSKTGTRLCFRSFIGLIVTTSEERNETGLMGFIPETYALRYWTEKRHDLNILELNKNFDDMGFPLFRQDQLQEMVIDKENSDIAGVFGLELDFHEWLMKTGHDSVTDSFEKLWLAFVMKEKFGKMWNGEEWRD